MWTSRGEKRGGETRAMEVDEYALLMLCVRQVGDASLLDGTGGAVKCSAGTQTGRGSEKQGHVYTHV